MPVLKRARNCPECDLTVSNSKDLQEHIALVHLVVPAFKCIKCNKYFNTRTDAIDHASSCSGRPKDSVNLAKEVLKCSDCGHKLHESFDPDLDQCSFCERRDPSFYFRQSKRKRFNKPTVSPHLKCMLCVEQFANKAEMEAHVGKDHSMTTLGKCDICKLRIFKQGLKRHMDKFHPDM